MMDDAPRFCNNKHLVFSVRLIPADKEQRNLTIDTETICDQPENDAHLPELLDMMHDKIIETFEGSISGKFREFLIPIEEK